MKINEARGRMSDASDALDHLRLFKGEDGSVTVEHHKSRRGDPNPEEHTFSDEESLLDHLHAHGAMPAVGRVGGEGDFEVDEKYRPAGDRTQGRQTR